MGISEIIGNLSVSKNVNFEIIERLSISENASNFSRYINGKPNWFLYFSQQSVIKKDPVVPPNDANLFWFNTDNLAKI